MTLDWLFAEEAGERVQIIRNAIDYAASEFAKHAQHKQGKNEDQLTQNVIDIIKAMGIDARHDVQVGGHCDIVVEASDNFMWLAEAKIHKSYDWLEKGYFQIATRYSTGLAGQNHGDLIIYAFNKDCAALFDRWLEFLGINHPALKPTNIDREKLVFETQKPHANSGLPYHIRHIFFVLHHAPEA